MRALDEILQVVLALLASVGLLALGWWSVERLLAPPLWGGPVYAVVPADGDGTGLEQKVKGLQWLRRQHRGWFTIVIADQGLDPAGRAVASALLSGEAGLVVCPADDLGRYIAEK